MATAGNRRETIADAAVTVIADRGIRGLTHRAVDEAAGLPAGSTSYYFRTRAALLEAVVAHLVRVDQAAFADANPDPLAWRPTAPDRHASDPSPPGPTGPTPDRSPPGPGQLDAIAAAMAAAIDAMLTHRRRYAMARYACMLEAARVPELRGLLTAGIPFREMAEDLLRRAGAPRPRDQATDLVACLDGLLLDRLAGAGAALWPPPGSTAGRDRLRTTIRALLAGMTGR